MTFKKDIMAIFIGLIIFISLFGSIFTVKQTVPDYAIVYADPEKKIYYAPPYIDNLKSLSKLPRDINEKKLRAVTLKEARDLQCQPDNTSNEKGYFVQQYRKASSFLLEKAGILKPLPSRWNKDGTWNW